MEWQDHLDAVALQCVVILSPPSSSIVVNVGVYYADVFDGAMITLAMLTLNVFHPGIYLRGDDHPSPTSSEVTVQDDRLKTTPNLEKAV
jgi:hypothetical protein